MYVTRKLKKKNKNRGRERLQRVGTKKKLKLCLRFQFAFFRHFAGMVGFGAFLLVFFYIYFYSCSLKITSGEIDRTCENV